MHGEKNGNLQTRGLCEKLYEYSSIVSLLAPYAAARLRSPLCNSIEEGCLTQENKHAL